MTAIAYGRDNQLDGLICLHPLVSIPILAYSDSL